VNHPLAMGIQLLVILPYVHGGHKLTVRVFRCQVGKAEAYPAESAVGNDLILADPSLGWLVPTMPPPYSVAAQTYMVPSASYARLPAVGCRSASGGPATDREATAATLQDLESRWEEPPCEE
jgi:hypothetical protein